jgi:wyosine [tRNA(Phe)-imidazoG37] synthetase (radical SAM superfamily)
MTDKKKNFVFGPVPSRRLGRSLGVDLTPFKTCSLNCIYCQVGNTENTTISRKNYVPEEEVIKQLHLALEKGAGPDVITFSGSGEPTLHSGIGRVIKEIKKISDVPVVVLTNGTLLFNEEVRADLCNADIVVPSLDASCRETFEKINRPHPGLVFDKITDGLIQFGKDFKGELLLEVFIAKGLNDSEKEVTGMASIASAINPSKVQLNTVTRPPAEDSAKKVEKDKMDDLANLFSPKAHVIASFDENPEINNEYLVKTEDVLTLLKRRPCRVEDISGGLAINRTEAIKLTQLLLSENLVREIRLSDEIYYEILKDR